MYARFLYSVNFYFYSVMMGDEDKPAKRRRGRPRLVPKGEDDADRDNWFRITLRIPPSLHSDLVTMAGDASLNATIIHRLETSIVNEGITNMLRQAAAMSQRRAEEAEEKLERSRRESFEEGRTQGLEEIRSLIEQTVTEAVRKALEGKL